MLSTILVKIFTKTFPNRNPGIYDSSKRNPVVKAKDSTLAANLLSNIVSQETTHNGTALWQQIENYTREFVEKGNEVYVISGICQISTN